jgi:hypothetical protein
MRVMTILGSPRRQGNTAKVLGWIEDQLRAAGRQVDAANILDYHVQGCGDSLAGIVTTDRDAIVTPPRRQADRQTTERKIRAGLLGD